MDEGLLNNIMEKFSQTGLQTQGVSFQGKSLKLNTENDCECKHNRNVLLLNVVF